LTTIDDGDTQIPRTKIDHCCELLRLNPDPNPEQITEIMKIADTSQRNVYRAIARLQEANRQTINKSVNKSKKKKKARGRIKKPAKPTPKGFKTKAGGASGKITKITKKMGFGHFSKYHSYPMYGGLYRWQLAWYKKYWKYKISLMNVARDHGKSILLDDVCQYYMSIGWDVLYLGWTARRKQVAIFIETFFRQRGELIIDKTSSSFHFRSTLGTSFDTFSVKSKEVLGMHEMGMQDRKIIPENEYLQDFVRDSDNKLLLIIDDPIDGTFREERHKGNKLEDFYDSTIMPINPNKTIIVGTKKYEEDFFYYIEKKYGSKLGVFKSGPFLKKTDERYGKEPDNPCNLLCPERWIWDEDPQYTHYLSLQKQIDAGVPISNFSDADQKLARKRDLWQAKEDMDPYWWGAEYEQNPHPITGEVWDSVKYQNNFKGTAAYDLCIIAIDRATTQKKASDFTGITVSFRERIPAGIKGEALKKYKQRFLVTNDFTRKIRQTDLADFIEDYYNDFRAEHGYSIKLIIPVEKQGGGDDFCDLVEDAGYSFAGSLIRVSATRNKLVRIEDHLGTPIKKGWVKFIRVLEHSELVKHEILTYPYMNKIDALDSLAMAYFEAAKIPQSKIDADAMAEQIRQHQDSINNPWIQQINQAKGKRRSIF